VKNILSFEDKDNPVKVKYNSEWLSRLNFEQVIDLASNFTVQQMLERDMFQKRIKENKPIHLHEFLYPLMQGYDSVAMDVDVELCGSDQIFNALAGRTLIQKLKNKNKFVIAAKMIADEKTGMLMSKSNGTGVFLNLNSNDLFGAIMSQPDGMIKPLFLGCTRIPISEIEKLMKLDNPRDAKAKLAQEIATIYHGKDEAKKAEEEFNKIFRDKGTPSEIEEKKVVGGRWKIVELLIELNLVPSKSEAKRLIEQGGVKIDDAIKKDWKEEIEIKNGMVVKAGKRKFAKIIS
jgi:tyrosyl-tRNA synthetase